MISAPSQPGELTSTQHAVRDTFQGGGSTLIFFGVLLFMVGVVYLTYWLSVRADRRRMNHPSHPLRLFHRLLRELSLSPDQQRLLKAAVRGSGVAHPSALLVSPALFDKHIAIARERLVNRQHKYEAARFDELVGQTQSTLFPDDPPEQHGSPAEPSVLVTTMDDAVSEGSLGAVERQRAKVEGRT